MICCICVTAVWQRRVLIGLANVSLEQLEVVAYGTVKPYRVDVWYISDVNCGGQDMHVVPGLVTYCY
jgi:hypothetical protein